MKSTTAEGGANTPAVSATRLPITDVVLLSSPTVISPYSPSTEPYGLHIVGTMTNRGFMPSGKVVGRGGFCADGKDWLSLSDLRLHKAGEGTPVAPYILGCVNGGFKPASRDIVMP